MRSEGPPGPGPPDGPRRPDLAVADLAGSGHPAGFGGGGSRRAVYQQDQQRRDEGRGVEEEAGRDPTRDEKDAADRRSEHPGYVEYDLVEADSVAETVGADQFQDIDLTRGGVGGIDQAVRDGECEHHPHPDDATGGQCPQGHAQHDEQDLGRDQQASPVDPVHQRSGPRSGQGDRQERERRQQAEVDSTPGQLEHQPGLCDALGHAARCRQDLAQKPAPECRIRQGFHNLTQVAPTREGHGAGNRVSSGRRLNPGRGQSDGGGNVTSTSKFPGQCQQFAPISTVSRVSMALCGRGLRSADT